MSMITDIERGLIARYLTRLLVRQDLTLRSARNLLVWLNERSDVLSLPLPTPLVEALGGYMAYKPAEFEKAWSKHRDAVVVSLDRAAKETPRPEPMATNVERLVEALGLPNAAWRLLGLFTCSTRFEQVQYLANAAADYCGPMTRAVSLLCDVHPRATEELLAPGGELVAAGLLQVRDQSTTLAGYDARFTIPTRVNACLERTFSSFDEMRNAILGDPLAPSVTMGDYDHITADRDLIAAVLRGAVDTGATGVNILLYGPPGSGKTYLAKVAAVDADAALVATGESAADEREADRSERLADIT
ncbi:MAG: ATP-binding protein, partial [Hyphomicrobium sp.]|nr:ATP-binding protein [Hyphomicrobium sp.]